MSPSQARRRFKERLGRWWPDLLLVALVSTAPGSSPSAIPEAPLVAFGIWLTAGFAIVAEAFGRRRAEPEEIVVRDRRLLVLAVFGVPVLAGLVTARADDPDLAAARFAAYAIAVVVAAARLPGWKAPPAFAALAPLFAPQTALAALAAGLELAPRLHRGVPPAGAAAPALLLVLAVVAKATFQQAHRERAALREQIDEHRRLRTEAEALRVLVDDRREPRQESLTRQGRTTRIMSTVADLDRDLDRLLALGALSVGARSLVLFLLAGEGERLAVRRALEGHGTTLDREAAPRLGEGVVGRAAQTRRPALFTNLDRGDLLPPLYLDETASPSLLVVPVSEAGVCCGVLVADAAAPGAFGSWHQQVLEGFATEVGIQLESARADAGREKRSHRLETLRFISQALSSTIKIDEVLKTMVELTRTVVPYDRCALFLVDPARTSLVLQAQHGFVDQAAEQVRIPFDHGLAGYIATHRNALLFSDLKERKRGLEIVPGAPGQERIRSLLGLPVHHQAGLVGIWVLVADEPGRFDSDHLDLLSVVAAQAATLISNAMLHQTVEHMAETDGLTGLYNHRWFQERLGYELERAERQQAPLSLLLMDIDYFKKINDTYGHPFGDQVLKALAATLGRLARRVDFVARYGGEEFAFLLVDTDRRGARVGAQRVLTAVRALRIPHEGSTFSFTLSLGTATFPGDATTREELVRQADRALYEAKRGGRDRAVAVHEIGAAADTGEPERPR